jgi:hypothetical protein
MLNVCEPDGGNVGLPALRCWRVDGGWVTVADMMGRRCPFILRNAFRLAGKAFGIKKGRGNLRKRIIVSLPRTQTDRFATIAQLNAMHGLSLACPGHVLSPDPSADTNHRPRAHSRLWRKTSRAYLDCDEAVDLIYLRTVSPLHTLISELLNEIDIIIVTDRIT